MKSPISFIIVILTTLQFSQAQPNEGEFIDVNIGFGNTFSSYEDVPTIANGFFLQGEYVIGISKWFGIRPYLGYISTNFEDDKEFFNPVFPASRINMSAFFTGGKFRLAIPIPYVAPFIESGIGFSFGNVETVNQFENVNKNGVFLHIPVSLGLALGKRHNFELAFKYLVYPNINVINGAATIGFSIPLGKEAE